MVAITVSAPVEMVSELRKKYMKMSSVFQFGGDMILKGISPDEIQRQNEVLLMLKQKLEIKTLHNEELIKKIAKIESELATCKEGQKISKKPSQEKSEEELIEERYGIKD